MLGDCRGRQKKAEQSGCLPGPFSPSGGGGRRHEKEPRGLREQELSLRGGRASSAQSLLGGCLMAGIS